MIEPLIISVLERMILDDCKELAREHRARNPLTRQFPQFEIKMADFAKKSVMIGPTVVTKRKKTAADQMAEIIRVQIAGAAQSLARGFAEEFYNDPVMGLISSNDVENAGSEYEWVDAGTGKKILCKDGILPAPERKARHWHLT